MKTKLILSAISALLLPLTCSGATKLSTLTPSDNPLSSTVATELLSRAYMHHSSLLSNAEVKVFDMQTSERFTSGGNIMRTILLCSVKHEKLPTEYYAVTFNGNDIVDGTLLGHDGDSEILKLKFPRDEMLYQPKPGIDFEFNGDTIKALRTYRFFSTARGGRWFNKDGTICNPFVISSGGTIKKLSPSATAIREDGDANYLSEDHKLPTRSKDKGEFYPLGMTVLFMTQTPVSYPLDIDELNKKAGDMMKIAEQYKEMSEGKTPETPETQSVMEFAKWSFNLGMRNSNEMLTWIAQNPNKALSRFFLVCTSETDNNESEWVKEKSKLLKDKKARKWWEKWIKENLE